MAYVYAVAECSILSEFSEATQHAEAEAALTVNQTVQLEGLYSAAP